MTPTFVQQQVAMNLMPVPRDRVERALVEALNNKDGPADLRTVAASAGFCSTRGDPSAQDQALTQILYFR